MATRMDVHAGATLRELMVNGALAITPSPVGAHWVGALPAKPRQAEIVAVAGTDPVLSAALLVRAADLLEGDRCSRADAVGRLGAVESVRVLRDVVAVAAPPAHGPVADLARRCWREAVMVAKVAQALCRLRGLEPQEGYTSGLVHDLGKLVGVAALRSRPTEARALDVEADWDAHVDPHHVEAGVRYGARVGLPRRVLHVLGAHHDPASDPRDALLATVVTADQVVERFGTVAGTTERDLACVPGLRSAAERIVVARILPHLAAAVDALEQPSNAPDPASGG